MAMKIVWTIIFQRRQPVQFATDSTGNYLGRIFVSRVMLSGPTFFRRATLTEFGVVNESKTSSHVANVSISKCRRPVVVSESFVQLASWFFGTTWTEKFVHHSDNVQCTGMNEKSSKPNKCTFSYFQYF